MSLGFTGVGRLLIQLVVGSAATSQFHGLSWAGLPGVLVYALLQTAFSECSSLTRATAVAASYHPCEMIRPSSHGCK